MQINADAAAEARPLVFAGFPASCWAFALRVWLAMLLALYVSFWLELESPSSSALTVVILALPTRGQGMEKAGYRLLATGIGVAASIAIASMFSQTDGLLLRKRSEGTKKPGHLATDTSWPSP
ncbi:putative membrane protein YccC [Bradyrhizobium sp. LB8.2]